MFTVKVKVLWQGICGQGMASGEKEEYLVNIRGDSYLDGFTKTHKTTSAATGAFKFNTLAAAEMAAVFVGGKVEEINRD